MYLGIQANIRILWYRGVGMLHASWGWKVAEDAKGMTLKNGIMHGSVVNTDTCVLRTSQLGVI